MIITDSMNRPGGVCSTLDSSGRWIEAGFRCWPLEVFFAAGPPSRPELPGFLGEWPCAALPNEIDAGNIQGNGESRRWSADCLSGTSASCARRSSISRCSRPVEIIANETTALSTHVLPTKDQLERADINLWDFLSRGWRACTRPPLFEPVGDRRSSWWVLSELGRRLGYDLAAELPPDDQPASDDVLLAAQAVRARCTFEDLVDNGYIEDRS